MAKQYLTIRQQPRHLSEKDVEILKDLCATANDLVNRAIDLVEQYYRDNKKYIQYEGMYKGLRESPEYKKLNAGMAQQVLRDVDRRYLSYFALHKMAKSGKYPQEKCRLPHHVSGNGYAVLITQRFCLKNGIFYVPVSHPYKRDNGTVKIRVPPILHDKAIKEIRIIPKQDAAYFEIAYEYVAGKDDKHLEKKNALAIDLGIENLAAIAVTNGDTYIIDGRRLKSINQWYNKEIARLESIKKAQGLKRKFTRKQNEIARKRNNQVNDYINKATRIIIKYCIEHDIGTVICGNNVISAKHGTDLGDRLNQIFTLIPLGEFYGKIETYCGLNGIDFIAVDESYTSKASFYDGDSVPDYDCDNPRAYHFSGSRVKRGLYRTKDGRLVNADINAAYNIMAKAVDRGRATGIDIDALRCRGFADEPRRIMIC